MVKTTAPQNSTMRPSRQALAMTALGALALLSVAYIYITFSGSRYEVVNSAGQAVYIFDHLTGTLRFCRRDNCKIVPDQVDLKLSDFGRLANPPPQD